MSQLSIDEQKIVNLVTRELKTLAQAGNSPWATLVSEGNPCFGCGERGRCAIVCEGATLDVIRAGADRLGGAPGLAGLPQGLAALIDHTLLKPNATFEQVQSLCAEAAQHKFCSVCVNPFWVSTCKELLAGSSVKVCTVIGFPLGSSSPKVKAFETRTAIEEGADEVDMVMNVGALKSGLTDLVERDIRAVVDAARAADPSVITKVILETAQLTDEEKIRACECSKRAGAHFVKTATGFGPGGATAPDIALMRRVVGSGMGVKASGGVRDQETAIRMVRSGASRIGASASVKIVTGGAAAAGAGY